METAYREWEKRRQARTGRGTASHARRRSKKVSLGVRERRRLVQLAVCIALFLVVFIGKGVFPDKMVAVRDRVLTAMGEDTDFVAAFSNLGRAISAGEPIGDTLGDLWVEVFGGQPVRGTVVQAPAGDTLPYRAELDYLTGQSKDSRQTVAYLMGRPAPQAPAQGEDAAVQPVPTPTTQPEPEPQPTPAPEPEVIHMDYTGPALPDNSTMDKYALGLATSATPVLGWVSSGFGWREHPVDGAEKFHNGVDLAVNNGTEVKAFGDGVVDYIGESPIYGKYLQLIHDNGVTTFYAHCSKLCVSQGETVAAGQKVAESGETGNATGPHLHFEIKKDGVRLNPLYYIETQ